MKKQILLIKPRNQSVPDESLPLPLGLICIGTVCKLNGYNVKIIDIGKEGEEQVFNELKKSFIVGISVMTTELLGAKDITKKIKEKSNVKIVWGGWHPTLLYDQVLKSGMVDFCVRGEGEIAFFELVKSLEKSKRWKKINNLCYIENGKVIANEKKFLDFNSLPEPDYSLVNVEKYINSRHGNKWMRGLPYETARGCPYRCGFCINHAADNLKWRAKSPERVANGVEKLVKKYNANFISFFDDNFFLSRERAKKIFELLIKKNLKINIFAECRTDFVRNGFIDMEILKLGKKAGLSAVTLGCESGSNETLKYIDKGITVQDTERAVRMFKEAGIIPNMSFILGFPEESLEDIRKTIKFLYKLLRINPEAKGGISLFMPFPCCSLTKKLIDRGLLKQPDSLDGWDEKYIFGMINDVIPVRMGLPKDAFPFDKALYYMRLILSYTESETKQMKGKYWAYRIAREIAKFRANHLFFTFDIDRVLFEKLRQVSRTAAGRKEKILLLSKPIVTQT